ncbi:MAG: type IV pilin protein [Gammaproteobacteria bacterium]|nr:type IV pilin protein [Gammaproteobacteria bacterium]
MIKKTRGFTLIELMIVITILAIIVTVGYPSYMEHVKKSRRAEGMGQLLELANRMERSYSDQGTYPTSISEVYGATTDGGFYTLSIVNANNVSFTVSAAPTSLGRQDTDKCATFTLTSLGQKSVTDNALNSHCWK